MNRGEIWWAAINGPEPVVLLSTEDAEIRAMQIVPPATEAEKRGFTVLTGAEARSPAVVAAATAVQGPAGAVSRGVIRLDEAEGSAVPDGRARGAAVADGEAQGAAATSAALPAGQPSASGTARGVVAAVGVEVAIGVAEGLDPGGVVRVALPLDGKVFCTWLVHLEPADLIDRAGVLPPGRMAELANALRLAGVE